MNKTAADGADGLNRRGFLSPYRDRRMAKILLLGFISGFPWLLIGSMLSLWLKEEGVSRSGIGLFGLAFTVYAFNFLWAPVIDGVRVPFLAAKFGRRRAWIVVMQIIIAAAMICLSFLPSAKESVLSVAIFIFVIACASATQDVAVDALRISLIRKDEPEKVGPGAAMTTVGWWLGFGGGKVFALPLVESLQQAGIANAWQAGYLSLVCVVALSIFLLLSFVREPAAETDAAPPSAPEEKNFAAAAAIRAASLYVRPVKGFVSQYTVKMSLLLLVFVFFFKIGEAFLGRMSAVFYREVDFSLSEIALVSGGLGTVAFCVFAVLGSGINARFGLYRGILIGGCAMASTNLLFSLLAAYPQPWLFAFAAVADQFTTAISTVAFVAFLSQLCQRQYAATQYAALASLGNLSRTTLAAGSGFLIDALGGDWALFFVLTTLMVLPSLAILICNRRTLKPIMAGDSADRY
ncbi:MAG: AmpG family muropeptide MFS transporter [Gammaproteobacteria bacterium]